MPTAWRACHVCGDVRHVERVYRRNGFTIVRCRQCGLVYSHEVPTARDLERIYSDSFFDVGDKFRVEAMNATFLNHLRRVGYLLKLPDVGTDRWLDVGCATGGFIAAAQRAVEVLEGVEFSHGAARRARQHTGAHVHDGDFLEVPSRSATYDCVTMWDYVEHVVNPMASLEKAFRALKPGGYLAISTGDIGSAVGRLMGRYWHLMIPPRHLYFFTPQTISRALTTAGFDVIAIDHPGKHVPLDFMVWKTASLFAPSARQGARTLAEALRLGRLALPVNLFDIMTVTARKPIALPEAEDVEQVG